MNVSIPGQGRVIGFYGKDIQSIVAMEECAELIQAISKMRRLTDEDKTAEKAYSNLVEEMADVLVVLEQLEEMYGISDREIQHVIEKKTVRQEERMHGHA